MRRRMVEHDENEIQRGRRMAGSTHVLVSSPGCSWRSRRSRRRRDSGESSGGDPVAEVEGEKLGVVRASGLPVRGGAGRGGLGGGGRLLSGAKEGAGRRRRAAQPG